MKKIAIFLALLLLCQATGAWADERESNAADKPVLFINTNSWWSMVVATNRGLARFAELARDVGFQTNHGVQTRITEENLEGVSVYVMPAPQIYLLDEDKVALRQFIRSGGALFLIAWFPSEVNYGSLNGLTSEFSVRFGDWTDGNMMGSVPAGCPVSGPTPCSTLYSGIGRAGVDILNSNNATSIAVLANGRCFGAISTHKSLQNGKLIIFGELGILATSDVAGYINQEDNEAFVRNILVYLYGRYDLRMTLCKAKLRGGKIKVTIKVRNISKAASEETTVRVLLSTTNTYAGGAPSVAATLATVDLPALNPGKSKKIKVKIKIPGWVTPGDYYVIAVADQDSTNGDSDTSNNWKASKKKITIN